MVWNLNVLATAVALLAGASAAVSRTTHKYTFNIGEFSAAPDGYTANILGVNNRFDVPIIVNKGDTIQVTAINNLNEPTSLHWHGMFQNGTNWYDGSSMVNQCPIKTGSSLTYKFTVNNQHGTYWWHSHAASQYVQGLRGPLIIHDPANEPYTSLYDAEIIVTLTDWFHEDKNTLLAQWFEVNGSGNEPLPDSALINGIGQYNCTAAAKKPKVLKKLGYHHMMKRGLEEHGKKKIAKVASKPKPACTSTPQYTTFSVTPGKRYRFRVINMSAMSTFTFSIDGHKMDVIEADGVDTIKTTVDQVRINTAQRYSVIVNMTATPSDYWFRAVIDTTQYSQNYTTNPEVLAIVHYNSSRTVHPPTTTPTPTPVSLDPYSLLPFSYPDAPATWDIELSLRFDINLDSNNVTAALVTVDGIFQSIQYTMPTTTPTLFDVLQNNTLDSSTLPLYIPRGAVVDLTVWNDDTMEHIFHLHGHQFWVLSHGAALNNGIRPLSTQQFPVRDTVAVTGCNRRIGHTGEGICGGGLGYTRIRWIADNPGVWLLHCHMEWHMAAGLAVTLIVDEAGLQANSYKLPGSVKNTCN